MCLKWEPTLVRNRLQLLSDDAHSLSRFESRLVVDDHRLLLAVLESDEDYEGRRRLLLTSRHVAKQGAPERTEQGSRSFSPAMSKLMTCHPADRRTGCRPNG